MALLVSFSQIQTSLLTLSPTSWMRNKTLPLRRDFTKMLIATVLRIAKASRSPDVRQWESELEYSSSTTLLMN